MNKYDYTMSTYKEKLLDARADSEKCLKVDYPEYENIVNKMTDFFTMITEKLDGNEIADEKLQYKLLLVVSFMRTHYVVNELIIYSEIIEAATLMRKQLELIARMEEIDVSELEKLDKKVPQIKYVPLMKEYYGLWSQVAHNANVNSLDLLGYKFDDEIHKRFYVQPTYTENTIATLDMSIGLFEMFAMEMINIMGQIIIDYKPVDEMRFLWSFNMYGCKTNIPFFEAFKERFEKEVEGE